LGPGDEAQCFSFAGRLHAPATLSLEVQTSKYILNATLKISKSFHNTTGGKKSVILQIIASDPTTFGPQTLLITNIIDL